MVIGIGLQRKERDMSKLKYLIDGKADEQFEKMLWCFGGDDPDSNDSGGGVSDEDLDEELQQDIAAAAIQQSGGNIGNYSYAPSFNQNDDDNDTLIQATQNILDVASAAPQGQMQQYIDQETGMLAGTRPVQQAIANVAFPPQPVNLGTVAAAPQTNLGSTVTGLGGEVFDSTTGNIISGNVDRYTGMNTDPLGQQYSTLLGNVNNALTNQDRFVNRRFRNAVNSGAIVDPNFNVSGQLDGFAANTGPFGSMVYTGMNNPNALPDNSSDDVVPPVANPMTGTSQCPDGYVFDDDLQACRRKTKRELQADNGTGAGSSAASGDMYYRRTSLDDAPANLPGGFNFADANRRFTESYGYRPLFYQNPMDTTGFTKLV